MNFGLKLDPIQEKDYVFGAAKELTLGGEVLQPDGQWDPYIPPNEIQNLNGIEPFACVSFATTNCVEVLERRLYSLSQNWSDRFLASISGTAFLRGNSPQTVAEILRKKGCVEERDYPFSQDVDTYDKYYKTIPQNLYTLAIQFIAEYSFGHEYVNSNPKDMMNALKYSPLLFTTYAWVKNADGMYYKPSGVQDNHATMCYGYEEGKYWKIFDSYLGEGSTCFKKVEWNSLPQQVKRFTLTRQIVVESAWSRFLSLFRSFLGL